MSPILLTHDSAGNSVVNGYNLNSTVMTLRVRPIELRSLRKPDHA